jgi:dipeptidyl aminopeptidase/acylaminoacyl peptidase
MFWINLRLLGHTCRASSKVPIIFLVVVAVSLPAHLRAGQQVFTPQDVALLNSVFAVDIAPGGEHIAYTVSVPRDPLNGENGPAFTELHVVDAGGSTRPFVTGRVNVSGVQWHPDGRQIAFLAKRSGDEHTSLYTIPIDGGEARRVTSHGSDLRAFAFHPDGSQLAFLASDPLPKERQDYLDQGFNQQVYEEDWRPSRVWIAATGGSEPPRSLDLEGSASFVQWSPTARQLAVVLAPTSLVDDSYMFKRVSIVDVDSGQVVERVQNPGKLGQVAWSPDGRHLALISGQDIHDPREGRLMVVPVPGSGTPQDLMPDYQAHIQSLAWKDNETVLWVAGEGTGTAVGQTTIGGARNVLFGPGTPILSGLSYSRESGRSACVGDTETHPGEVFLLPADGQPPQRLTKVNPGLDAMRFARQEVIRWTARDGLQLEGVLVYPLNYQAGRRYPLILTVHGGPEAHDRNGWVTSYSRPGQVGAARGFAVFYPNYRGSTGRGVAFSKLGQADAAGREFDDLVDAVDHLIEMGLVDRQRVGITGGSYGGYATAWGATYYSDRFAAAVMFVGISSNVSKIGTTDIPEEMYLVHHRKRLWEDWDYFLDRSPIRYVQRHQTPILILHGNDDPRVDPSQSRELYRHLKTLGQAPVRLVLYPGEGHGNRNAAARLDYNIRLLRWMEHYLQGPGGAPPDHNVDYAQHWNGQ